MIRLKPNRFYRYFRTIRSETPELLGITLETLTLIVDDGSGGENDELGEKFVEIFTKDRQQVN